MRKITEDSVKAFFAGKNFRRSNTEVVVFLDGVVDYYLFGKLIATYYDGKIIISNAGWDTPTTKDRLNGILSKAGAGYIFQKSGTWYWKISDDRCIEFPSDEWIDLDGNVV